MWALLLTNSPNLANDPRFSTDTKPVKVMLLAGADLIESFGVPDLWATDHVRRLLGNCDFSISRLLSSSIIFAVITAA